MTIDQLTEQFKSEAELRVFADQQFKQILNLTKKIKELEEKNKKLQEEGNRVNNSSSLLTLSDSSNLLVKDDAKAIAQVQLKMLKESAFGRELTLEETKKLEIFNKITKDKDEEPKTIKASAKTLSSDNLLSLIGASDSEAK